MEERKAPDNKLKGSKVGSGVGSSNRSGGSRWSRVSKSSRTVNIFKNLIKADIEISEITLLNCKINEPQTYQFKIKNTSGIDTDFYFYYEKYEPVISYFSEKNSEIFLTPQIQEFNDIKIRKFFR